VIEVDQNKCDQARLYNRNPEGSVLAIDCIARSWCTCLYIYIYERFLGWHQKLAFIDVTKDVQIMFSRLKVSLQIEIPYLVSLEIGYQYLLD
jgi:hypothetical protein